MIKQTRRHYLLLEVLIAFFLLVLCALPLLYPHAMMLKEERNFIHEIRLSRAADLVYASIVERLHTNDIDWNVIDQEVWQEIGASYFQQDKELFKELAYAGRYQFFHMRDKGKEESGEGHHYYCKIVMEFKPKLNAKAKPVNFAYSLIITRKLAQSGIQEPKVGLETPPKPQTSEAGSENEL